ncbi:hypothetical protein I305_01268 [Cryptococcus gattii E566]|uniref:Spindle assembly checkpoint component MAD1 n=1 Tax=Cryptococcus gattii serotype B (strain WM276 / ATCC MYA-4071) TaxID=367775 RepID=E6QZW5_CRYGW|nr:Protein complex assembly-related protein, putative [Cryptococcus gattii WM276]ADV20095.1 Protein complex assembly-related protein, putative [Cryptococcus gattii WM276]KIY36407.1 hypothetical protein I305_01268 [Cryptococcus gattii E566]KJE05942.1 hypothetical protein I311_00078 [Cryptococcus gattii NT-10]
MTGHYRDSHEPSPDIPSTQFIPEANDADNLYEAVEIMDERGPPVEGEYLIKWSGTDEYGRPWKPSWEKKSGCTDALIMEWKEKKRRHPTIVGKEGEKLKRLDKQEKAPKTKKRKRKSEIAVKTEPGITPVKKTRTSVGKAAARSGESVDSPASTAKAGRKSRASLPSVSAGTPSESPASVAGPSGSGSSVDLHEDVSEDSDGSNHASRHGVTRFRSRESHSEPNSLEIQRSRAPLSKSLSAKAASPKSDQRPKKSAITLSGPKSRESPSQSSLRRTVTPSHLQSPNPQARSRDKSPLFLMNSSIESNDSVEPSHTLASAVGLQTEAIERFSSPPFMRHELLAHGQEEVRKLAQGQSSAVRRRGNSDDEEVQVITKSPSKGKGRASVNIDNNEEAVEGDNILSSPNFNLNELSASKPPVPVSRGSSSYGQHPAVVNLENAKKKIARLEGELTDSEKARKKAEERPKDLVDPAELRKAKKEIERLKAELKNAQDARKSAEDLLAHSGNDETGKISKLSEQISDLRENLMAVQVEKDDLEEKLKENPDSKELAKVQKEFDEQLKEKKDWELEKESFKLLLSSLNDDLDAVRKELEISNTQNAKLEKKMNIDSAELAKVRKEMGDLRNELDSVITEKEELKHQLRNHPDTAELAKTREEIKVFNNVINDALLEKKKLEEYLVNHPDTAALADARCELKSLSSQLTEAKQSLSSSDAEVELLRERIASMERSHKNLVEDNAFMRKQYDEASNRAVEEVQQANLLRDQVKQLTGQLKIGLKQREIFNATVAAQRNDETCQLRAQIKVLLDQSRRTDDDIRHKAQFYKKYKAEYDNIVRTASEQSDKIERLEERVETLVDKLETLRAVKMGAFDVDESEDENDNGRKGVSPLRFHTPDKGVAAARLPFPVTSDHDNVFGVQVQPEAQAIGPVIKEGGDGYVCKWRVGDEACQVVCDTVEEIHTHAIAHQREELEAKGIAI